MERKYRVWDKVKKEMCDVEAISFFDRKIYTKFSQNEKLYIPFDEALLMQSTGLKDKNGVEIFEGDILSRKTHVWMYGSDLNEWVTESYPVVWQDGGWCLNEEPLAFILEEGVYSDGFRRTALEVIGNIYENPELLKEEIKNENHSIQQTKLYGLRDD